MIKIHKCDVRIVFSDVALGFIERLKIYNIDK